MWAHLAVSAKQAVEIWNSLTVKLLNVHSDQNFWQDYAILLSGNPPSSYGCSRTFLNDSELYESWHTQLPYYPVQFAIIIIKTSHVCTYFWQSHLQSISLLLHLKNKKASLVLLLKYCLLLWFRLQRSELPLRDQTTFWINYFRHFIHNWRPESQSIFSSSMSLLVLFLDMQHGK